jgi:hypothetical protein
VPSLRRIGRPRTFVLAAAAALAALAVVLTAAGRAAAADTPVTVNIAQVKQMVVDSAQSLIFFASGQAGPVVVTHLDGTADTTIHLGVSDDAVDGLALSPDGSVLFATIPGDDEIAAIQTADLTAAPTPYATDVDGVTQSCPTSVATDTTDAINSAGTVWFSYGCTPGTGALGNIDLATGTVTDFTTATNDVGPAALALSTADPTTLVAEDGSTELDAWDISSGAPATTPAELAPANASFGSVAVGLNGATPTLYAAGVNATPSGGSEIAAFSLPSLTAVAHVSVDAKAVAVDPVTSDAAVSDSLGSNTGSAVDVFQPGLTCQPATLAIPQEYAVAMGFSSDGSTLYAVGPGQQPRFTVVSHPTDAATAITVNASPRTAAGRVMISGRFSPSCDVDPGPVTLTVSRSSGASAVGLPSVTTAADGSYSFIDTPPSRATGDVHRGFRRDAGKGVIVEVPDRGSRLPGHVDRRADRTRGAWSGDCREGARKRGPDAGDGRTRDQARWS